MLFYLDMRQIKITEQQLKNIIVGEGFSFEPYYVKNKDGNTVKRQKMVYRPNLNTQSKKDAINDFNQNNLTNSFSIKLTNEPSFIGQKGTEPIVQDKSMQIFYNKIITYLAWYVIKNNINTIIVPQSSSSLTTDIINKTKLKIPNGNLIYSFNDLIVKNYNGLKIDMNKAKENNLNNDEIQDLQYRVNLANKKGMYNIKTFSGKERNVLNNLFTINSKYQNYITKVITNKNVLVFDDNYSTGVTLDETCLQLQQYNPKSIVAITIGEIRKPKQSVRF